MDKIEITLKDKKKLIKGFIFKMAVFAPFKVIQVKTDIHKDYYLVYFHDSLVYGDALESIGLDSFINHVFDKGIVLESNHPFLSVILPEEMVLLPNKNKIFSILQNQYTLLEVTYLTTTLDSFFTKDQLMNIMDKIYFHYRRNGKFFKAFQILNVLLTFSPQNTSTKDRFHAKEYYSYADFYRTSPLSDIYQKDPLYVELHCFNNRFNPDENERYKGLLTEQNRSKELLLLWMEKVQKRHQVNSIDTYTSIALSYMSMEKWIATLCYLNINPFKELSNSKAAIHQMISEKRYETAAFYLLQFIDDLPPSFDESLNTLFIHLDTEFIVSHLDGFLVMFQQLIRNGDTTQFEQKLSQLVGKLLESHDFHTVYQKIQPIQALVPHSLVMNKLKRMMSLLEDPDQMMELGQYYAEFKRYDDAIECFSWEMELRPDDISPVWQLSKMYQQKGMVEEATAYQQVCNQLKRNQDIG